MISLDLRDLFVPESISGNTKRFNLVLASYFETLPSMDEQKRVSNVLWKAECFRLDQVQLFQELSGQAQERILWNLSQSLIAEVCQIEMLGLSYAARMSLESENLQERMFYSMMASEEAQHFALIRPFAGPGSDWQKPSPFTQLIAEIIQSSSRADAILLIQVLLEGWGMQHFSWLAQHCTDPNLREAFKKILKDEARHHAGGSALLSLRDKEFSRQVGPALLKIFQMVKMGPVGIYEALSSEIGLLSETQKKEVFDSLNSKEKITEQTQLIQNLISPYFKNSMEESTRRESAFAELA